MRLLTLNVHGRLEDNIDEKMDEIVAFIVKQDVDYIALQEVAQEIDDEILTEDALISLNYTKLTKQYFDIPIKSTNYAYQLVKKLKQQQLAYRWSWAPTHIGFDSYDEGVAVLSKTKFEAEPLHLSKMLDYSNYHTRFALVAKDIEEDILVFSTHHSWWENDFSHEWNRIEDYIKNSSLSQCAILGDFNNEASVDGEGYHLIMQSELDIQDSFIEAKTTIGEYTVKNAIAGWDDHHDQKRIDYQFFDQTQNIEKYEVVFDGDKYPIVSDHFGIFVNIQND